MFLGHPRVVGFRPWDTVACSMAKQLLDGTLIKQFFDGVLIQAPTYSKLYPILKLYPAIAATHLCPMASKLGIIMT